jgi:hypothetical protein
MLCPLLFVVYVGHLLPTVNAALKPVPLSDGTSVIIIGYDIRTLLKKYFMGSKLILNSDKTNTVTFVICNKPIINMSICYCV